MAYALEDEFGDIIGKARRGLGLSVNDVAGRVGVSAADLEKMESYEIVPEQTVIDRFAAVLGLQSERLGAIAREEWEPAPSEFLAGQDVAIKHFLVEAYNANVYLLVNRKTQTAVLIDAGGMGVEVAQHIRDNGINLLAVLFTHGHGDHTEAVGPIHRQTGAAVFAHPADARLVGGTISSGLQALQGSETLDFHGIPVQVRSTPGHTAGSVTYVVESAAFTGDTLFAGSMGRCSLDYAGMLQSIHENILALPAGTGLYPGHGPASSVQEERDHNPFLG